MKRIHLEASSTVRSTVLSQEFPIPMTTKKTVSQRHVSQSHESNVSIQEVPMTTKKTVSHAHVSHASHVSHAATSDASTPAEVAPHVTVPVTIAAVAPASAAPDVSSSLTRTPSLPLIALAAPPANALIPPVPSDYVSQSGATYRNVSPRKTELLVLAQAIKNLAQFTSYTQVMGTSAPSYQETLALFTVVYQWSAMRTSSSAWDAFCVDQEGLGWATLRPVMASLRPMLEAAMKADATLAVKVPALVALLGARTAIAMKGAATRQRNRAAKAKGEPETHGKAGKTRKRAEEKAALETLQQQQASTAPGSATAGQTSQAGQSAQASVTTAPVSVVTTPAATGTSPVVSATSAVPAVTNGVNGSANGAGH
jgi:hypothetical protein